MSTFCLAKKLILISINYDLFSTNKLLLESQQCQRPFNVDLVILGSGRDPFQLMQHMPYVILQAYVKLIILWAQHYGKQVLRNLEIKRKNIFFKEFLNIVKLSNIVVCVPPKKYLDKDLKWRE